MVFVAFLVGIALYIIDLRDGGILNKVDKGQTIIDLMTSPKPEERRKIAENTEIQENLKDYMLNKNQRNALRRSMAAHGAI